MTGDDSRDEQPFDPYRYGKPDYPVPPEYAPPGYVPDPPAQPLPPHPYYGPSPYGSMPPPYAGGPYPPPGQYPGPPLFYPPQQGSSGLAITSLVLGILSIFASILFFFDAVFVILALVFGIVAVRGRKPGRSMAIAGISCAVAGAILATLVTVAVNREIQRCGGWSHLGDPGFSDCVQNS
jgi:hypothetical protein